MNAEIICIGDELLIGQVINTNATWLAQQLNLIGIEVYQVTAISDNKDHIKTALETAGIHSDIIVITGGLGPTKDDITKQSLCEYFNTLLKFDQQAYEQIEELFRIRGLRVTELNKMQAEIPENCTPIKNVNGTAPGMWFEDKGKTYISLPGVPFEMQPMMTDHVLPALKQRCQSGIIIHKTVLTQGVGESWLSEMIADWEDNLPESIKLAYLPQPGIVRLRLSARGSDKNELSLLLQHHINLLKNKILWLFLCNFLF